MLEHIADQTKSGTFRRFCHTRTSTEDNSTKEIAREIEVTDCDDEEEEDRGLCSYCADDKSAHIIVIAEMSKFINVHGIS